jgi:hypothetical protein
MLLLLLCPMESDPIVPVFWLVALMIVAAPPVIIAAGFLRALVRLLKELASVK